MLSEGVHSLVDTGNQGLLLYGKWRAARPADDENPLGHARELYFWGFVVALLIFSAPFVSFYEGLVHLRHPTPIENPLVNYIVLGLSLVFEGVSWTVAFHEFDARRGDVDYLEAIMRSKDPSTAAVLGILIAFAGTVLSEWLSSPVFDGAASIGIAIVLGATAVFLARESKGLLIGEPASREINRSILRLARSIDTSTRCAVHLGPHDILAALTVDFANAASAKDVERTMAKLDRDIKERHPEIRTMFFKVDASA